jgi:hypothetical protein
MKRYVLLTALVLSVCASIRAQTSQSSTQPAPDVRSFELNPASPPTPALKYHLLFDSSDRYPGNAAIVYMQALLFLEADTPEKAQKALDAYEAKDLKTFDSLASSLELPSLFDELNVAGRRESCDWDPPIRDRGPLTLLPHLGSLARGVTNTIKVRALRQIQQGKLDDALATLRLGYEAADKVGREPILISALVSNAMTGRLNDVLARVMTHPNSPNLYWALSTFPSRRPILRRAWDQEYGWLFICSPTLNKARLGEELSAEQWRKILIDDMVPFYQTYDNYRPTGVHPHPDPIKDASPQTLRAAQQRYAETHHLSADQAAKVDPAIVLGNYYLAERQVLADEVGKLRGLPYAVAIAHSRELQPKFDQARKDQPSNPLLELVEDLQRTLSTFARSERQLAALTAVEAIRSYAAANAGALPKRLQDVTDTPVPENPATGSPFEYRVENDTSTLSDSQSDAPLTYTIRIRR